MADIEIPYHTRIAIALNSMPISELQKQLYNFPSDSFSGMDAIMSDWGVFRFILRQIETRAPDLFIKQYGQIAVQQANAYSAAIAKICEVSDLQTGLSIIAARHFVNGATASREFTRLYKLGNQARKTLATFVTTPSPNFLGDVQRAYAILKILNMYDPILNAMLEAVLDGDINCIWKDSSRFGWNVDVHGLIVDGKDSLDAKYVEGLAQLEAQFGKK